jgi:hypothetical protein
VIATEATERYDANGDQQIELRRFPVWGDVTDPEDFAVKIALDRDFGSAAALEGASFAIDVESGIVSLYASTLGNAWLYGQDDEGNFPLGKGVIEVTYTAGLAESAAPADLGPVLADLVMLAVNSAGAEGIESETIGAYSYRADKSSSDPSDPLPADLSPTSRAVLRSYLATGREAAR